MKKAVFTSVVAVSLLLGSAHAAELRVVIPSTSAATEPFFKKIKAGYEKAHPDTKINLEVVNWDNLYDKLTTDVAGGAAPDVSIIGTRWLTDFVKNDVVEPLDSYITPAQRATYIPTFLSPGKLNGKIYGLPVAASARAMYYNADILKKAGVSAPPKTWAELQTVCAKVIKTGSYCFGLQGKEVETDAYWYYALWSHGGDILTKDGKSGVNSAAAIKAATLYKTLIDKKYTQPGVTGYSRENVQDLFKQGRLAFVITAPFLINQLKEQAPKLNYGITGIPTATKATTYGVTDSIAVFKSSPNKKAAYDFVAYVLDARNHIDFTKDEGFLPITKGEAQNAYFTGDKKLKIFTDLLPNANFAPNVPDWEKIAEATSTALQNIYLGKQTPKAALDAAAGTANGVLGK